MGPAPNMPASEGIFTRSSDDASFFCNLFNGRVQRPNFRSALRYGTKESAGWDPTTLKRRWKYTHAEGNTRNIVYITDETSTRMIKSYPERLLIHSAMLTEAHIGAYKAARKRLQQNPSLITSHTVLVVDQSSSMGKEDVVVDARGLPGGQELESRTKAVFRMLALDFVGKQRLASESSDTDLVSLVLMHDSPTIVFDREPSGLVLYNKFVSLHYRGVPYSKRNYLPALNTAEELLNLQCHPGCALSLVFLSNGQPHDPIGGDVGDFEAVKFLLGRRVYKLAGKFGQQLSFSAIGFATQHQGLSVLQGMAAAANQAGAQGSFHGAGLTSHALGTSIARSVSSFAATKAKQASVVVPGHDRQPRNLPYVEVNAASSSSGQQASAIGETRNGWMMYSKGVDRLEFSPPAATREKRNGSKNCSWVSVGLSSRDANCVAMQRHALSEGAERLVFGLQEFDSRTRTFVGPKLVAKKSREIGQACSTTAFHDGFAKTQRIAKRVADRFNRKVKARLRALAPDFDRTAVWDVSFLPCHVYTFLEADGTKRNVLAEKKLELASGYIKWNGNHGYVRASVPSGLCQGANARDDGSKNIAGGSRTEDKGIDHDIDAGNDGDGRSLVSTTVNAKEAAWAGPGIFSAPSSPPSAKRSCIEAGGAGDPEVPTTSIESNSGDTGVSCAVVGDTGGSQAFRHTRSHARSNRRVRRRRGPPTPFPFTPDAGCYVQAFSHFSYECTRRKALVCNLQGTATKHDVASRQGGHGGVLELTDPVVHFSSGSGRDEVVGKPGLGKHGIRRFFETHTCNDVCHLLGIAKGERAPPTGS